MYDAGHMRPGRYDGRYCVGCEAYVATEVCAVHGTPTEVVSEDNWFFALSSFAGPLAAWLDGDVVRPVSRRNEALGWLRRGLEDFSISRASLTWGVPLPWDPTQVAYVWFDALAAYLTGGSPYAWSPAHHVIGKDILRFHAIWWPAILLAADLPLPSRITVHGFLLQRGGKIAKTTGGAFVPLDTLLDTFGADGLRYGLLRGNPIGPDGEFTVEALAARYNADLANTLGNLVSRLVALVSARACRRRVRSGRLRARWRWWPPRCATRPGRRGTTPGRPTRSRRRGGWWRRPTPTWWRRRRGVSRRARRARPTRSATRWRRCGSRRCSRRRRSRRPPRRSRGGSAPRARPT